MQLPYEIINLILGYKAELDDDLVYVEYHLRTGQEKYRINFTSGFLMRLRALLMTRFIYPLYHTCPTCRLHRSLYESAISYYHLLLMES